MVSLKWYSRKRDFLRIAISAVCKLVNDICRYILVYPQGCDVCNHLSLFLCVADYDKLLPGDMLVSMHVGKAAAETVLYH